MLKETETEETRTFVIFLSLVVFRLGGPGPTASSPGYAYDFPCLIFYCRVKTGKVEVNCY